MCGRLRNETTALHLEKDRKASQINFTGILVGYYPPLNAASSELRFFNFLNNFPCSHLFCIGDFFRKLWGPYAGWAQSVSYNTLSLFILFPFDNCFSYILNIIFQVLFCADLKKFQKLKETPKTKHLQKEESDKEGIRIAGKKAKIKEEANKPVKLMKTKSARHRK